MYGPPGFPVKDVAQTAPSATLFAAAMPTPVYHFSTQIAPPILPTPLAHIPTSPHTTPFDIPPPLPTVPPASSYGDRNIKLPTFDGTGNVRGFFSVFDAMCGKLLAGKADKDELQKLYLIARLEDSA